MFLVNLDGSCLKLLKGCIKFFMCYVRELHFSRSFMYLLTCILGIALLATALTLGA